MQALQPWLGMLLPYLSSLVWRLAPDRGFDGIQFANPLQYFLGKGGGPGHVYVIKLPATVCPARCLDDPARLVQCMKAGIGIGLQDASEVRQVRLRVASLAVRGIGKPHCRRHGGTGWPVIAHIGPEPPRLRLATARCQDRDRGVIGM